MKNAVIRIIKPDDNKALATIVRSVLAEFGANRPGTVYYDQTTDNLFALFQQEKCIYYVAIIEDEIVGGAGIFASAGLPEKTCELVRCISQKMRAEGDWEECLLKNVCC